MSDKKIIIRNCPAILKMTKICDDYKTTRDNPQLCKDCTDCVMKQMVELCGKYQVIDVGYQKVAINYLASDILKLLDIEECE